MSKRLVNNHTAQSHLCRLAAVGILDNERLYHLYKQGQFIYQANFTISVNTLELRVNRDLRIPYKTIVLDLQYGIVATNRSTNALISQLLQLEPFNYFYSAFLRHHFNQHLPQKLQLHEHLPLIMGNWCFLPLQSHRHRNATWIALHHLCHYEHEHSFLYTSYVDNIGTCLLSRCRKLDDYIHEAQCMQQQTILWLKQLLQLTQYYQQPCQPYHCHDYHCPRCQVLTNENFEINQLKQVYWQHFCRNHWQRACYACGKLSPIEIDDIINYYRDLQKRDFNR
ncbi:MAG: hypothetical protein H9901_00305 [Candidatus Paralactobacillus gallistercoris]|uniref:Uncharacterized protein n=1 Tax=Candidatus Paralactobacillus gallistercoris TaxID=2838724 RepID=A0A948WZ37_9LACO|nr:hypothetical protein [Candidatus Paralactobacillus gallistercoris]